MAIEARAPPPAAVMLDVLEAALRLEGDATTASEPGVEWAQLAVLVAVRPDAVRQVLDAETDKVRPRHLLHLAAHSSRYVDCLLQIRGFGPPEEVGLL